MTLKDYQSNDHHRLNSFGKKGIIAYEMGMGKTAESVTYVEKENLFPCLIVCPPSASNVFLPELRKWIGKGKLAIVNNGKVCDIPKHDGLFVLITYGLLDKWAGKLRNFGFKSAIWDEAHKFANIKTKRNQAVRHIAENIDSNLFLTGSVFANKVDELFTMLNILNSDEFPDVESVQEMHESGYLFDRLNESYMIRRRKEDHLDLPEKKRDAYFVDIDNFDDYKFAEQDFINWLYSSVKSGEYSKVNAFTKMEKLKQLAIKGKLKALEDFLQNRLRNEAKTLVYFTHTEPLIRIKEKFGKACEMIKGGMSKAQRLKAEQNVMTNDSVRLMVGNVKAAGESLTLTTADMVILAELPWTALACDQVENRAHRIGQTRKVKALYFIARDTIEERIVRILDRKRILASETLDGIRPKDSDLLQELLNEYKTL